MAVLRGVPQGAGARSCGRTLLVRLMCAKSLDRRLDRSGQRSIYPAAIQDASGEDGGLRMWAKGRRWRRQELGELGKKVRAVWVVPMVSGSFAALRMTATAKSRGWSSVPLSSVAALRMTATAKSRDQGGGIRDQKRKPWPGGGKNKTTATAKAKYGGLSTAQRTIKLSVASVEMTWFYWGRRMDPPELSGGVGGGCGDRFGGGGVRGVVGLEVAILDRNRTGSWVLYSSW